MKYIICDIECTCWAHNDPQKSDHETIEIGCVFLDEKFNKLKQVDFYTWPKYSQTVSEYCTDLTGISYKTLILNAIPFSIAIKNIVKEIDVDINDVVFCSWGKFDKSQLEKDCDRWNTSFPFSDEHINIKQLFLDTFKIKRAGLQKAVRMLGLRFNGSPHNALDDANMTAEVFKLLKEKIEEENKFLDS